MIDRRVLRVKLRQNLLFAVVTIGLLGLIFAFVFGGSAPAAPKVVQPVDSIRLMNPAGGRDGDQALWVQNEDRFSAINKKLADLQREVDAKNAMIADMKRRADAAKEQKAKEEQEYKKVLDTEINQAKSLEAKLNRVSYGGLSANSRRGYQGPTFPNGDPFLPSAGRGRGRGVARGGERVAGQATATATADDRVPDQGGVVIQKISLKNDADLKVHSVKDYLPAGSYAEATVISGVDASVGLKAKSAPLPLLLRVTSPARSAADPDGKVEETNISGCMITGAAYGDLSAEKVYTRLVKMTCSRDDGTVVETKVHGFVTSVGKAGVRGHVVSREGDFITQAFLAGMVGGLGQGAAMSTQSTSISPLGTTLVPSTALKDIAISGFGMGAQSGSAKVEQYLINRAEQYQPVVQLNGGTRVEVVFEDGVRLDGAKE